MSKSYILAFNSQFATRQQVQEFLSSVPQVTYWYGCLPSALFFTGDLSANEMAKLLEARFGIVGAKRFIVIEVSGERQGRMPSAVWHMLRNPAFPILPKN